MCSLPQRMKPPSHQKRESHDSWESQFRCSKRDTRVRRGRLNFSSEQECFTDRISVQSLVVFVCAVHQASMRAFLMSKVQVCSV